MKKQTNRFLSLLLSFVMVLGMLPAVTPHVHAAGTGEVQLIGPSGIAISSEAPPDDSGYTNEDLLAFYLNTGGTYTLTTNGTSTNAVSLLVNTTDDITVVLDHVSFDVVQPKRSSWYELQNDKIPRYNPSALEIVQADSSLTVNVELKIKGVNDLKAAAKTVTTGYEPAVLQLTGVNTVISGYDSGDNVLNIRNGTVEGTTFSPNGIRATNNLTLGSGVTYNIGDYSNKDANLFIGNDGVSCAENLVIADGAVVNVGIDNPNGQYAICLAGKKKIEAATVNLRVTYGSAIYGATEIGDGAVLTAVSEDHYAINIASSNPLVIGDNATVSLTSNSDDYSAVNLDNNTSFSVGENSKVTINSHSSKIEAWAVKTSRASVSVGSGSEVTVNSGYGGFYCDDLTLGDNAKLIVHADTASGINMGGDSITVGSGATLHVSSNESYGINAPNSNAKIYLNSGNVLVYGKKSAFSIYGSNKDFFVRGITSDEEITTYHSSDDKTWEEQDSVSWTAFTEGQTDARWFKTEAGAHVHVYTNGYECDGAKHHYGVCICGEKSPEAEACTYPDEPYYYYPTPTETKDGKRTWKCTVCKGSWVEIIPAHNCADYINAWEDYGNATKHKGECTYLVEESGNTCGNEVYADHTFTEWAGDSLTISRTCTGCGRVESKNTHENVTHMEAIAGDCSKPGRIEFWHCTDSDCGLYFSDELMTQVVAPEDTFTTPGAHSYGADGVCSVCGDKKTTVTFVQYEDNYYYSDMDGELFILVGFKDGKAYVMGNETNADGSRNAVEIPVKANGAIDADSATAEFFALDWDEATFSPDGGYMSMMNGKIVVYDKARVDEDGLPKPMIYSRDGEYYDVTGYLKNWTNDWCIVFDAETLTFKVTDTPADTIVRYKQVCPHENLWHTPAAEATCTEQGAVEYWYCDECYGYFMNHDFEKPVEIDSETELTKKATGHKFDADGICENCGMKRHVYTQVSTLAEFDALSKDASYIIVFKDGDKTYAAYYPDVNAFDQMVSADSDGDGVVDLLETDANANGIPDIIENYIDTQWSSVDYNEDGVKSAEEYNEAIGSYDEDEDVDIEDYKLFFSYDIEYWLYDEFWEENAINRPNVVEVTVAADGSITVTDEGAMEFQMMVGGVWGSQPPLGDDYEYDYEYFGILDTERMRAAWIPNYWIGASGLMGYSGEEYFMTQKRFYGDGEYPGIIDHKNWKISFREDGTACLVNSWTDLEDTGALQLAKYTDSDGNTHMTIVGLPEWQWEYSDIMLNRTALLPAYLYASEPTYAEPPHECVWGPWEDDDVTETHTRWCTVDGCTKKQTEDHNWDDGVQTSAPTCTEPGTILYTCPDCNATKTDSVPALDHDWGDWVYDSVDSHIRNCKRNCGVDEEFEGHEWGEWLPVDDNTHKMTCSVCNGCQTEEHDWDDGVVTKEPTEWEEGLKTYTCGTCSHTKTEPIDKLVHECTWTDWYPNGDDNHKRDCMDDNCDKFETEEHDWDDGVVTKEPTCKEKGVKTFTCQVCMHTRTEDVPTEDHEFGDWTPNNDGTHTRACRCNATETKPCEWDDGVVTAPTCTEEGKTVYTCTVCGNTKTESIPALEHDWGDWTDTGSNAVADIHERACNRDGCDAKEFGNHEWGNWISTGAAEHKKTCSVCSGTRTAVHEWNNGEVVHPATQFEDGLKVYTCVSCGEEKKETIPKLDIPVNNTPNDNAAGGQLADSDSELIEGVLTEEEKAAVADGSATVSIYLEVEDISDTVTPAEVTATTNAVAESGAQIGMYLDIDLFKDVTTAENGTDTTQITETNGKITITIVVPDELINTDPSITRIYKIVRVHDGWAEIIEATFDPDTKTLTFETDKFSTYALAYNDNTAKYTISFNANGGTVSPASAETDADGKVSLPTPTRSGSYSFKGWYTAASGGTKITADTVFTENTTIYAQWTYTGGGGGGGSSSSYFFNVNVKSAKNGELYVSPIVTFGGSTVTILATPDKGYVLSKLLVTDSIGRKVEVTDKGEGKYTFTMPASNVTVEAAFGVANPFEDVVEGTYYYDAVVWAVSKGITNGTSETTFSPDASCTRAQMVTFLWRAAGSPEPKSTTCPFADVDVNSYYGKAVLWAVEKGITNGTSETTFSPDATCTRAQMATFLCRMAEGKTVGTTNAFTDVAADQYYTKPVQWAVENGITNGTSETTFSPDAFCTRAQMVTFLYRYFVK